MEVAVRVKRDFPRTVRELENVWIPLPDGCRLAARIWLPEDAERDPVPGVLEYIPYRKGDWAVARDSTRQPYVAGHGYAAVRVDIRGTGDSEGVLLDEYLAQEQDDAVEVIRWIAAQPWCTGDVGMWGISWGGFNALQVAARRPPELRAIVTLCSTDDRYADDVHYRGGCALAVDMLPWAANMLVWNAAPPDPRWHGDAWRALWLDRLDRTPPYVEAWLTHQRRDAYWAHGSVCEDPDAIQCPVYAVGGWADGYTNAVPRLLATGSGPRKGLIGPWAHGFPEDAVPGPSIGFLQECLRWWDRWLKDGAGNDDEPLLRAWMQDWVSPCPDLDERPGRWVAEEVWPPPREPRRLALGEGRLLEAAPEPIRVEIATPQATGLASGLWCPYGDAFDLPPDQRPDDELSVVFDWGPLDACFEVFGMPKLVARVECDEPIGLLAARLCDVAPDGSSLVVSRGLLNLTHRESHSSPTALEPGKPYEIELDLDLLAHAFPAGHSVRLALSTTYWPWAWPSPAPASVTLSRGELLLPERPARPADAALAAFEEPESAPTIPVEELSRVETRRDVGRDGATTTLVYEYGGGRRRLPDGTDLDDWMRETFTIVEGDPLSAAVRVEGRVAVGRGEWRTRVEADTTMTADADAFHVSTSLDAYEGDDLVFTSSRPFSVPRDLV